MNNFCVYKHTSPNGKVYIGITSQNAIRRWRADGSGYRQNKRFYNAIKKYGWDNFTHEILFTGLSEKEACDKEIELISYYGSYSFENGYNQSLGGEHGYLGIYSRQKISQRISELWDDDSYREHMSNVHKGQSRTGWHHTDEAKRKMSEYQRSLPKEVYEARIDSLNKYRNSEKGRAEMSARSKALWESEEFRKKNTNHLYGNTYRRKKVECVETGQIFDSVTFAAESIGVKRDAVGRVCRGLAQTSGGYHWRFMYE